MQNITANIQIQFDKHGNGDVIAYTQETLARINEVLQREMGDISPIIFINALDRSDIEVDDDDDDEESHPCPECGAEMDFAMLPDDVGNGLHEGHECSHCGHSV